MTNIDKRLRWALLSATSFAAMTSTPALSQTEDQASSSAVEDIVVTAERRTSSVQSTALAISAMSGDQMRQKGILDMTGVTNAIPNVQFSALVGQARLAVRGIAVNNVRGGDEGAVAFYLDGVYVSRPAAVLATMFDVERTEILRGPQGTLYGRNATGGAVNVLTKNPTSTSNGYLTVDVGNYSSVKTEGAIGLPITDKISGRIAFQTVDHGGYGNNPLNNNAVDDQHTHAVRGKLKFDLSDNFDLLLTGDYSHGDDHAGSYIGLGPGIPGAVLVGTRFGGTAATGLRDINADFPMINKRTFYGFGAEMHLGLGSVDLVSISSFRSSFFHSSSDTDLTNAPLLGFILLERSKQYSQELRLSGKIRNLDWITGAYYFREHLFGANDVPVSPGLFGAPTPLASIPPLQIGIYSGGFLTTNAYAFFGQVKYHLTDRLGITGGLRFSHDKKSVSQGQKTILNVPYAGFDISGFPAGLTISDQNKSWKAWTPKVTVDFKATDKTLLYATWSKGFKAGGYYLGNASDAPFNPAYVTSYEAGVKADWLDGRLRTNLSAFYYDYKNMQVQITVPFGFTVITTLSNAASSRIKGLEAEITALPIDNLRLDASFAYLDARFRNFSSINTVFPAQGLLNLKGNHLLQSPPYTINVSAAYTWPTERGDFTLRGDGRWVGQAYYSPFEYKPDGQSPYSLFNASFTYENPSREWTATAYIRNIGNRTIRSWGLTAAALVGNPIIGSLQPPRTFGASLGYRF